MTKFYKRFSFLIYLELQKVLSFGLLIYHIHQIKYLLCIYYNFFCGITTPIINDFLQLKGTLAINLSPINILKFCFLSKLSETLVKPLNVSCSPITPYLNIVKQYFFWGLEISQTKFHHLYNRFFLKISLTTKPALSNFPQCLFFKFNESVSP